MMENKKVNENNTDKIRYKFKSDIQSEEIYSKSNSQYTKRDQIINEFLNLKEIRKGIDIWQNEFHEYDVYDHTKHFVIELQHYTNDINMLVAGCLHDIGKPIVAKPKLNPDGTIQEKEPGKPYHTFDDHEKVGEQIVREMNPELFKRYGLDQEKIAKLVGSHYLPMKGIKAMRKAKDFEEFKSAFEKLEKDLEQTGLKDEVMLMFLADKLAQGKGCTDKEELMMIRDFITERKGSLEEIYNIQRKK